MTVHTYFAAFLMLYVLPYSTAETSGPGKSACAYYGAQDVNCQMTVVPVSQLPDSCTSIVYDGVLLNSRNEICDANGADYSAIIQSISTQSDKGFFLVVSHDDYASWHMSLDPQGSSATKDINLLCKTIDSADNITGLIFKWTDDCLEIKTTQSDPANLKAYLDAFKKQYPKLQFGIEINAKYALMADPPMMDFTSLSSSIDFFSISFYKFNKCNKFTMNGTVPIHVEGASDVHTLEQVKQCVLPRLSSDNSKIFFNYWLNPDPHESEELTPCQATSCQICTDPQKTKKWCADSTCSLLDKGKFASDYGGFIGYHVDLDDPNCACECGKSFPAFNYLVDGSNGKSQADTCDKFDRLG